MVPASLLQQFAIRITPQQALLKLGCKGNLTAWHQTGIQQVCSIPRHIYGEDQNADAKAPAQVKEGVGSLGVQLCCSASASLGVFDKLTLCQTECQTQLVKYTQCCTAAVSRLTVFTEMLSGLTMIPTDAWLVKFLSFQIKLCSTMANEKNVLKGSHSCCWS